MVPTDLRRSRTDISPDPVVACYQIGFTSPGERSPSIHRLLTQLRSPQGVKALLQIIAQGVQSFFRSLGQARRSPSSHAQALPAMPEAQIHPIQSQILITADQGDLVFHFTPDGLKTIQNARSQGLEIKMPRELLSYLRQASMFQIVAPRPARSSRLSAQRSPTLLQSALTFCTCYYQGILEVESTSDTPSASPASLDISWAEVPDPAIAPPLPPKSASDTPTSTAAPRMIRTMISIDGDIVQQIQADALTLSNFDALLRVHYWLIQQLLHHLRLEIADYIDTGVFIIWLGLLVLGLVQDWTHPLNALWGLLRSVVISVLLAMLWELLRDRWLPRLQRWIVRWLWEQILNPDRPLHRFATWFMGMK